MKNRARLLCFSEVPPSILAIMTRILFVGQKPEMVDFSDPALPPCFNAEKINAGIALGVKKIEEPGWQGDTCMITPDTAGSAMLEKALTGANYDCVVIGGGMRLPPKDGASRNSFSYNIGAPGFEPSTSCSRSAVVSAHERQ
jgi:hypothetical protein